MTITLGIGQHATTTDPVRVRTTAAFVTGHPLVTIRIRIRHHQRPIPLIDRLREAWSRRPCRVETLESPLRGSYRPRYRGAGHPATPQRWSCHRRYHQ